MSKSAVLTGSPWDKITFSINTHCMTTSTRHLLPLEKGTFVTLDQRWYGPIPISLCKWMSWSAQIFNTTIHSLCSPCIAMTELSIPTPTPGICLEWSTILVHVHLYQIYGRDGTKGPWHTRPWINSNNLWSIPGSHNPISQLTNGMQTEECLVS